MGKHLGVLRALKHEKIKPKDKIIAYAFGDSESDRLMKIRKDITFFHNKNYYSLELKTSNTNWKNEGITNNGRPITKNIQSIISDAIKYAFKCSNY